MDSLILANETSANAVSEKVEVESKMLRELAEAELMYVGGGAGEVIPG